MSSYLYCLKFKVLCAVSFTLVTKILSLSFPIRSKTVLNPLLLPASDFIAKSAHFPEAMVIDVDCSIYDSSFLLALPLLKKHDIKPEFYETYEIFFDGNENFVVHNNALLLENSYNIPAEKCKHALKSLRTMHGSSNDGTVDVFVAFSPDGIKMINAKITRKNANFFVKEQFIIQTVRETDGSDVFVIYPTGSYELNHESSRQLQSAAVSKLLLDAQADNEYVQYHGGTCESASQHIQEVVSQVSAQYEADVGFSIQISNIFCDTSGQVYPSTTVSADGLLGLMTTNWGAVLADTTQQSRAIADFTHLFTGKDLLQGGTSGVVGLAYNGSACARTQYSCSLTMNDFHEVTEARMGTSTDVNTNLAYAANNAAHEIGHMLNASHCIDNCPYTMNAAIIGASHFGADSISIIQSYRAQTTASKTCYCDQNQC